MHKGDALFALDPLNGFFGQGECITRKGDSLVALGFLDVSLSWADVSHAEMPWSYWSLQMNHTPRDTLVTSNALHAFSS